VARPIVACQPPSGVGECLAQEGTSRLRRVQAVGPTAERGGIGQAIRVFERCGCLFPGAVLDEAPLQGLTANQEAVMCVRERKRRQEGEGLPTTGAETATDPNPVVLLVVGLLAPTPVANDRIALTNGTAAQDDVGALFGPIGSTLALRGGKRDK